MCVFLIWLSTVFGIDLNGLVNEWNDKTAEITGYSKDEAMGKPLVSKFIVKKLKKSVQGVLDNALKGKETSNYELEFRTKSNEIRYLLVNATTRRDPENNVVGVVGVAQVSEVIPHVSNIGEIISIHSCNHFVSIGRNRDRET